MHRTGTSRALAVAAAMLLLVMSRDVLGSERAQTPGPRPGIITQTKLGVVVGTAWKGDTQPYPNARIRLRNVETAREVARTVCDGDGLFRFVNVEPGVYVVELLSTEDKVLAVGDIFGVPTGGEATTLVRLGSKAPWVAGFFGNAAAAAIAAASTLGVTAVGSNGSPASGQ